MCSRPVRVNTQPSPSKQGTFIKKLDRVYPMEKIVLKWGFYYVALANMELTFSLSLSHIYLYTHIYIYTHIHYRAKIRVIYITCLTLPSGEIKGVHLDQHILSLSSGLYTHTNMLGARVHSCVHVHTHTHKGYCTMQPKNRDFKYPYYREMINV